MINSNKKEEEIKLKKTKNLLIVLLMIISMIIVEGCSSTSSGDKFLGKWQDISNSKTVITVEYVDSKHKVLKLSDTESSYTGKLDGEIIKLDTSFGNTVIINSDKNLEITGGYPRAIYKKIK